MQDLGCSVKELRCYLVEDVRRFEQKHVKDKAAMMDQVGPSAFTNPVTSGNQKKRYMN